MSELIINKAFFHFREKKGKELRRVFLERTCMSTMETAISVKLVESLGVNRCRRNQETNFLIDMSLVIVHSFI